MKTVLHLFVLFLSAIFVAAIDGDAQNSIVYLDDFVEASLNSLQTPNGDHAKLNDICSIAKDPLSARIFREYGAVFAGDGVTAPTRCIFESEKELELFQLSLNAKVENIGGVRVKLQDQAMSGLTAARTEAAAQKLSISPRGGSTASIRSFQDTKRLWDSRFLPGLEYWIQKGKISAAEAESARKMNIAAQVRRVLDWESKGYFFNLTKDRTILSSVAAPGTSQHLSGLAFDVAEFGDSRVREIMNRHGWFQTVADDTPHFTYIGVPETKLPQRGLILKVKNGYKFWIPNIKPANSTDDLSKVRQSKR